MRLPLSPPRMQPGSPCQACGSMRGVRLGARYCGRCRSDYDPTPLQKWRTGAGFTIAEVAEATGLGRAAVSRADGGERVSEETAIKLHRLTKIPVETFRPEEDDHG